MYYNRQHHRPDAHVISISGVGLSEVGDEQLSVIEAQVGAKAAAMQNAEDEKESDDENTESWFDVIMGVLHDEGW